MPTDLPTLRDTVAALMDDARRDLEALVRIPSVSAAAYDQAHVAVSADAVAALLTGAGMPTVEVVTLPGVHGPDARPSAPAVIARRPAPDGAPTVLLYAHHDVQPPGDPTLWTAPAFEPTERDGRLYGRGAADDKAGVMAHVTALRALLPTWGPQDGVGVTVFVEGEEESGSPSFSAFLAAHREALAADVIVVADSSNWAVGVPALTTSLRGLVEGTIEVRTLDHALHSGMYGGVAVDAMTATVRLLDRLWDDAGDLAVPGLVASQATLDYPESTFRADAGVPDGVDLVGTGSIASRLWTRPALTVTGIDAPSTATASNTLLPTVTVKFSMRIAPGQDPHAAFEALRGHLAASAPWGARVDVRLRETGEAFAGAVDAPAYAVARTALRDAWDGTEPVDIGIGGSIPFIADLVALYPDATVLVTGVEDPDGRAHGTDESLHLGEFARACLAETLLLDRLRPS